jgi:hypothetical protein
MLSAPATPQRLLELAAAEVGTAEHPSGSNRTKYAKAAGHINGYAWCATFVVAMCRAAGVTLPSESAYTPWMARAFTHAGIWHTSPEPGDVVFFDFAKGGDGVEHVGIVESVRPDGRIVTIEGNTSPGEAGSQDNGGGVYRRVRSTTSVVGYGRPAWATPLPEMPASQEDDMIQTFEVEVPLDPTGRGEKLATFPGVDGGDHPILTSRIAGPVQCFTSGVKFETLRAPIGQLFLKVTGPAACPVAHFTVPIT